MCTISNSGSYVTSAQEECPVLSFPLAGEHEQNIVPGCLFLYLARQPPVGQGLLIHEVSSSHTTTLHTH